MSLVDVILIVVIGGFAFTGWRAGLVHTLGALLGTVLGVYFASRYYENFAALIMKWTGWQDNFSKVLTFIIAFVVINRLIGLGFWLLDRTFGLITRLPFIHGLDSFLGLIFGLIEGMIVVGISVYFINKFPIKPDFIKSLAESSVALYCVHFSAFLWPLMPKELLTIVNTFSQFTLPGNFTLPNFSSSTFSIK